MACDQKIVNVTLDAPVSLLRDNISTQSPTPAGYKTQHVVQRMMTTFIKNNYLIINNNF